MVYGSALKLQKLPIFTGCHAAVDDLDLLSFLPVKDLRPKHLRDALPQTFFNIILLGLNQ